MATSLGPFIDPGILEKKLDNNKASFEVDPDNADITIVTLYHYDNEKDDGSLRDETLRASALEAQRVADATFAEGNKIVATYARIGITIQVNK